MPLWIRNRYFNTNLVQLFYTITVKGALEILSRAPIGLALYDPTGSSALLGVPLKIREYQAAGLCIIVSNMKHIIEYLEESNTCYFVIHDLNNEEHINGVLEKAFTTCIEKRQQLLEQNIKTSLKVCEEYNWIKLAIKYLYKIARHIVIRA